MRKAFFSTSEMTSKKRVPLTPRCGLCGLSKDCLSPKMKPTGKGRKKILFIAEAPGKKEDEQGIQLIGEAGQRLRKTLRKVGLDLDKDCWKTNAIICRPSKNETPTSEKIICCRPNIMKAIKKYKPNVIVLLGGVAIESLLGHIWKEKPGAVGKWMDWCIPNHDPNCWIIPTYHPSYLLRKNHPVLDIMFEKHLRLAKKKSKSKPWDEVPDFKKEIQIITNPAKAAREIKVMMAFGKPISFDYEANCLKSKREGAKIYSCSICWNGQETIAYPWEGEAIEATSLILKSPIPKIGCNIKFENNWTKTHLGHNVKNWWFDSMLAAHVLNNSKGITSAKFQAFVQLGQPSYNDHIEPYLKGKTGLNRIHELDMKDLLLYNGMDALLEFKVAMIQMKQLRKRKII